MQQRSFNKHLCNETFCAWIDLKFFMTGKYSLGNAQVEFWTDLTIKLVDIVCVSITMYLC